MADLIVRVWSRIELRDAFGRQFAMGVALEDTPTRVTAADQEVHDQTHSVAAGGTIKLFDIADDLGDFDFLAVETSVAGQVQFVNNSAANFFTLPLGANAPMVLVGDGSLDSSGTVGAFDGSADDIERVYFKNTDGSSTAKVRVLAAT